MNEIITIPTIAIRNYTNVIAKIRFPNIFGSVVYQQFPKPIYTQKYITVQILNFLGFPHRKVDAFHIPDYIRCVYLFKMNL